MAGHCQRLRLRVQALPVILCMREDHADADHALRHVLTDVHGVIIEPIAQCIPAGAWNHRQFERTQLEVRYVADGSARAPRRLLREGIYEIPWSFWGFSSSHAVPDC